jgi:hypothetical protein
VKQCEPKKNAISTFSSLSSHFSSPSAAEIKFGKKSCLNIIIIITAIVDENENDEKKSILRCRSCVYLLAIDITGGGNLGQYETFDRSTMLSFGILVGLLTALICVIIGIVVVLKIRTANNKKSNNKQRPGNLPIKEKISVPLSQSEEMYDEKNPDVVPSTEGEAVV